MQSRIRVGALVPRLVSVLRLFRIAQTDLILLSKLNDADLVMNSEALESNSSASNTVTHTECIEVNPVNKDRVKGVIDEVVGGMKRKAGKLTGDTQLQVLGVAQQAKGKLENAWGQTKDAVHATIPR